MAGRSSRSKWQRLKEALFGGDDNANLEVGLFDSSWSGKQGTQQINLEEQRPRGGPRGARLTATTSTVTGSRRGAEASTIAIAPANGAFWTDDHQAASPGALEQAAQQAASDAAAAALASPLPPRPPSALRPAAAAAAAAAPPPPCGQGREVRASSLPQPLDVTAQQQHPAAAATAATGSGPPGAPVSPDLAAPPPVLRRVSSTPLVAHTLQSDGVSFDSAGSMHKSLSASAAHDDALGAARATAAAAAAAGRLGDSAHDADCGSENSGSRERSAHGGMRRSSSGRSKDDSCKLSRVSSGSGSGSAARTAPARQAAKPAVRARSPVPASQQGTACGITGPHAARSVTPSQAHQTLASAPPPASLAAAPVTRPAAIPPTPPAAAPAAQAAGDGGGGSPTQEAAAASAFAAVAGTSTVSLLSLQLRGSTPASAAASRETSVRSTTRAPAGGLSLALSRENSNRGVGSARSSRNASGITTADRAAFGRGGGSHAAAAAAATATGLQQQHSGGSGRHGQQHAHGQGQRLSQELSAARIQQVLADGGSNDWMGLLPPVSEVLPPRGARPQGPPMDPFAPSTGHTTAPSAAVDTGADASWQQPQQVGSWASRVTNFTHSHNHSQHHYSHPHPHYANQHPHQHSHQHPLQRGSSGRPQTGGLDPRLLAAALEALAGQPADAAAFGDGAAGGSPSCAVLVGDSDLAVTSGHGGGGGGLLPLPGTQQHAALQQQQQEEQQQQAPLLQLLLQSSWPTPRGGAPCGGAPERPAAVAAAPGALLSSSWDAAAGVAYLPPLAQLGGSAPAGGFSRQNSADGSFLDLQRLGSQALPCELAAATRDWNRSFMKRWRAVKKRAYLQALGLRALWRVNSLSDRHEPVELLTNDLPQYDNGMRRAWSVTRLIAQREEAAKHLRQAGGGAGGGLAASAPLAAGQRGPSSMHKDPSLGALLLGEVAEVC